MGLVFCIRNLLSISADSQICINQRYGLRPDGSFHTVDTLHFDCVSSAQTRDRRSNTSSLQILSMHLGLTGNGQWMMVNTQVSRCLIHSVITYT